MTSPTRRAVATLAAAAGLALSACGSTDDDPLGSVPAFALEAPTVALVLQGENPRSIGFNLSEEPWETTIQVAGGVSQTVAAAGQHIGAAPAGGDVTTATLPVSIAAGAAPAPKDGEPGADDEVTVTVGTSAHSPTHSVASLNDDIASASGFLLRWRAVRSGAVSTVQLLAPDSSTTQGRETVESALFSVLSTAVVFPAEPVGVGGVWTVSARTTGDTAMMRTATYTLEEDHGRSLILSVDVDEEPLNRAIAIDNDAAGTLNGQSLAVEDSSTTSQGSVTVDVAHPLPVAGTIAATTRVVYSGPTGGSKVVQDSTSAVTFGS
ncbi:hypothetical protein [Corynebacterium capitovis]|uniref:hypothetical protein n=1 Tax=Corynebacterium capitovis TaxID=131081 RepID=UPI0014615F38|nr:hypothetical protein [Corynebacterium capitovis]